QPSLLVVLPSSHSSFTSWTPSPQASSLAQSPRQPSPLCWLPSSQPSPGSRTPLPQAGRGAVLLAPAPVFWLPSAHPPAAATAATAATTEMGGSARSAPWMQRLGLRARAPPLLVSAMTTSCETSPGPWTVASAQANSEFDPGKSTENVFWPVFTSESTPG